MKSTLLFFALSVPALPLFAQSAPPARKLADLEPALAKIASYEFSQPREPLIEFEAYLRDAIARRTELPRVEARLVRMLGPGTTVAGKDFVCRQLSLIGTSASVPALVPLLKDGASARIALYALERIPGDAAGDALRASLAASSGMQRIGFIDTLGWRREEKSVKPLAALLGAPDDAVSGAAYHALGEIGSPAALAAIRSGRSGADGLRRHAATAAYVRCAGAIAASDPKSALAAFREVVGSEEPVAFRIAALGGLARIEERGAVPLLAKELGSSSPQMQAAAIRLLKRIPGTDATAVFVQQFPKLSSMAQIRVLGAFEESGGGPAALAMVVDAANSGAAEVRTAALAALGKIGNASIVPLLAQAAATREGAEQAAARTSLYTMRGGDIDPALLSLLGATEGKVRLEVIKAAGERGSPGAADALLRTVQSTERDAARESMRALRTVAAGPQEQALLDIVTKTPNAAERREAALTLVAVIRRSGVEAVGPVLAALQSSTSAPVRISLMEVAGQVSAAEALPVLRLGLKDSDPGIVRAAILALSEWQTPDTIPDLQAAAKDAATPTLQILALRGLTKVIAAPSDRSRDETVKLLAQAMQLAKEPAEKRAILAQLQNQPTPEALKIATAAAADPAVQREAKSAAEQIRAVLQP
jgi:HEAT repeat protein